LKSVFDNTYVKLEFVFEITHQMLLLRKLINTAHVKYKLRLFAFIKRNFANFFKFF